MLQPQQHLPNHLPHVSFVLVALLATCTVAPKDTSTGPAELSRAAQSVVGFLRGAVPFDSLRLEDSVTFHVAPDGGGARVTRRREELREIGNWSIPVNGRVVSLVPPPTYMHETTFVGQHVACTPSALSARFAALAVHPHVGVRRAADPSASCLQTWNVTLVFSGPPHAARLTALVYDQWEW